MKLPAWQATSVAAIGSFVICYYSIPKDPFIADHWCPMKVPQWQSGQSYWLLQLLSRSFITSSAMRNKCEAIKQVLTTVTSDTRRTTHCYLHGALVPSWKVWLALVLPLQFQLL
ncbi:MAG: hypothetical protein ACLUPK_05160 [Veillonella sp.]